MQKYKETKISPYSILTSEVLPYELPLFFNFKLLREMAEKYRFAFADDGGTIKVNHQPKKDAYHCKGVNISQEVAEINADVSCPKTSFRYYINKDGKEKGRELVLIHPYDAFRLMAIYRKFAPIMLNACSRSNFSVRYPFRYATKILPRKPLVPKSVKLNGNYRVSTPRTFFGYRRYGNINTFFSSKDFQRYESKFRHLLKTDITHCFDNIPRDRLAEAVYLSKSNHGINDSFADQFQKFMADVNDNRFGIAIGPEFSRIYAEMILQRIDCEIESRMKEKGFNLHRDYECNRYVDDMFFFYTEESVRTCFEEVSSLVLGLWGMKINEKKTVTIDMPSVTAQTLAKRRVNILLDQITQNRLETSKGVEHIDRGQYDEPFKVDSMYAITDLVTILTECKVQLSQISSYLLSHLQKKLCGVLDTFDNIAQVYADANKNGTIDAEGRRIYERYKRSIITYLCELVHFVFFIFNTDTRMSTSLRVVALLDVMIMYADNELFKPKQSKMPSESSQRLFKMIHDELVFVLRQNTLQQKSGLEITTLLSIMADLSDDYAINDGVLNAFINGKLDNVDSDNINFLMVMALDASLKKRNSAIKSKAMSWLQGRLELKEHNMNDAECYYIHDYLKGEKSVYMRTQGVSLKKACWDKISAGVY